MNLPTRKPTADTFWQCPRCGETLEIQFGQCWNCGTTIQGRASGRFVRENETLPGPVDPDATITVAEIRRRQTQKALIWAWLFTWLGLPPLLLGMFALDILPRDSATARRLTFDFWLLAALILPAAFFYQFLPRKRRR